MNLFKKSLCALYLIMMCLCITACSGKSLTDVTVISDENNNAYPVTITDHAGRKVTIENEPQRLVSGYYISSSLLIALDLDEKMVGIESNAAKRDIYKLSANKLLELPSVGSVKEFDLEGCAALKPDLVILTLKLKDVAASLEELGIKTILVNPESNAQLIEMIDMVAMATNTTEKGEELKSFITKQESELNGLTKTLEHPKVYLSGNSSFLLTASDKMYQADMIKLAGGKNVAGDIDDTYWAEISYEQLLSWNPEYIIIAANAEYTVDDVLNDKNLDSCDAVINKNVYKLPVDAEAWDSPVPAGILGSVWLTNILHPEELTDEKCKNIIEEFYEKFYGFKYSEI